MTQVAADFGISDVALKKICDRHRIPSPPRGYWAKKNAGQPVKQIRFVETANPQDELVVIHGSNQPTLPQPVQDIIERDRVARAARRAITGTASATTAPPEQAPVAEVHQAVASTAKALRRSKPDKDGAVSARGPGTCGVTVGAACVERAIAILDRLARALETRGLALVPAGSGMTVTAEQEAVKFALSEKIKREQHIPTVDELAAEERRRKRHGITWDSPYGRVYPEWDFIRTSLLTIEFDDEYLKGFRRTWNDGKRQRLEDAIEDIAVGLMAYAAGIKLRKEERERRKRYWERQSRVHRRAEQRAEREKLRRGILDELVAISTEAAELRTWLHETEQWQQPSEPDEFCRFVDWARERLDQLQHGVGPGGIAQRLRARSLFPVPDPLIDPPEDLAEE